jgi:2-iminobutanoate/2-iminopropanoate deaminase
VSKQIIRTPDAPGSPLYSQGIKAASTLHVSGTVGIDPKTGQLAGVTIQEQTRQALRKCENILRAGGASLEDVVEVQALLARPADFGGFNEEYARSFPADPPTRSVGKLGVELPGVLISIKMTAAVG